VLLQWPAIDVKRSAHLGKVYCQEERVDLFTNHSVARRVIA